MPTVMRCFSDSLVSTVLVSGRQSSCRARLGWKPVAHHYWARRLASYGHTARLMAAEFVVPFRKSKGAKNDRNDAQAILSAVRQPDMRFVGVKSIDDQAVLAWHRMRK